MGARSAWAVAALAIAFAAGITALQTDYAADIHRARQRIAGGSTVADTACGPIEYADVGSGAPLLLVHGAGGGFDQGLGIAHDLARRGIRVVLPSRFGYLRTPLPADASAEAQADAHACLLDALKIERAAVAGVSAGAPSAMQFALRHARRTSALLLLVPAGNVPEADAAPPAATGFLFDTALRSDFLFWAAMRVARDTLIESILATPPDVVRAANQDERQRVDATLENILPVSERRLGLLNDARVVSTLPRYPLERVTVPSLIVSAKDDGFNTWRVATDAARRLPNARFVGFDRGGHLWIGHHAELIAEVASFVEGNAGHVPDARP